jgi:hypothetical protein|eukprot:COSAG01_NODE_5112_length_4474_cov_395.839771_3_plen_504_part_00
MHTEKDSSGIYATQKLQRRVAQLHVAVFAQRVARDEHQLADGDDTPPAPDSSATSASPTVTARHLQQARAIIEGLRSVWRLDLPTPGACGMVVEFGAADGVLSSALHTALLQQQQQQQQQQAAAAAAAGDGTPPQQPSPAKAAAAAVTERLRFLLVDRMAHPSTPPSSGDCGVAPAGAAAAAAAALASPPLLFHRVTADVEQLSLTDLWHRGVSARLGEAAACWGAVGIAKHLCGEGTDHALRVMVAGGAGAGQCSGVALAFACCCHHRCNWRSYVAREFFLRRGWRQSEFEQLCTAAAAMPTAGSAVTTASVAVSNIWRQLRCLQCLSEEDGDAWTDGRVARGRMQGGTTAAMEWQQAGGATLPTPAVALLAERVAARVFAEALNSAEWGARRWSPDAPAVAAAVRGSHVTARLHNSGDIEEVEEAAAVICAAARQAACRAGTECWPQLQAAVRAKRLLDEGRRSWLEEQGWGARLGTFASSEVSPENALLVAHSQPTAASD